MVTTTRSLTDDQQALYTELFEHMEQYSGKKINDLHEYLAQLDILMQDMSEHLNANNYNLLRLPLTEPVFEINPDTREIKVPDPFIKNGLTVQGDKLAEIVWFRMPRFFDLTDFYNFSNAGTKSNSEFEDYHTYIEWYNPNAKVEEHSKGVDLAYAMTCDEQYIYFGWPLADKVSGEAGTVQFAVRFLGVKDHSIKYNFSTKPQSCQIKTTLNFDLLSGEYRADSWEDLIYSRPVYSGVVNSINSPAPVIIQGLVDGFQDLVYDEDTDTWGLKLEVKAAAPNSVQEGETQELKFVWQHQIQNMSGLAEIEAGSPYADDINTSAYEDPQYTTAAKSTLDVSEVGRYTVLIGNKLSSMNNVRYVYTGVVEVPRPTKVNLDDTTGFVTRGYTDIVYANQFSNEIKFHDATLTVTAINPVDGDEIHYQWKRRIVTGYENGKFVYETESVPDSEGGKTNSINPTKEGIYWVEVYSSRNLANSDVTYSRVADMRKPPQSFSGRVGSIVLDYDSVTHTFRATIPEQHESAHKVKYIWYYKPLYGRTDSDNIPVQETLAIGGVNGIKLNNNAFVATKSGTYWVEGYEVVFDTEDDVENSAYTTQTIESQRARSEEVTISDDLTLYVNPDEIPTDNTEDNGEPNAGDDTTNEGGN